MARTDFVDTHHIWWPRRSYQNRVKRRFRNLPCYKVRILRSQHELLHRSNPPRKPHRMTMQVAIRRHNTGRCNCVPEEAYHGGRQLHRMQG